MAIILMAVIICALVYTLDTVLETDSLIAILLIYILLALIVVKFVFDVFHLAPVA